MTTEGYRGRVLFRSSPQAVISCRSSMAVGPETAKSAVLASSWFCPESAVHEGKIGALGSRHSHLKMRDDIAMQIRNTSARAPMFPMCADHESPAQIPRSSETAYVSGKALEIFCTVGDIAWCGTNSPDKASIGYRISAPAGCANRAVGTMLAITKPTERMLHVEMIKAIPNANSGTSASIG